MKIITLNTWGGRAGKEGLLSFASEYKNSIDVFCFHVRVFIRVFGLLILTTRCGSPLFERCYLK